MNYKIQGIAMALILSILASPLAVLAQGNNIDKVNESAENKQNKFCASFENQSSKMLSKLDAEGLVLSRKQDKALSDLEAKVKLQEEWLVKRRQELDVKRQERLNAMESKLKTEDEKQEWQKFKDSLDSLVAKERQKVDKAHMERVIEVKQWHLERLSKIENMRLEYRKDLEAVISKIKSMCQSGADRKDARKLYQNDVKALKNKYKLDVQSLESLKK